MLHDECEHEGTCDPFDGSKPGETECSVCKIRFLICPGCSEDSCLNHAPAVYHAAPLCARRYTDAELAERFMATLG